MHRIERDDLATVMIEFEGKPVEARKGDSVAAALLAAGHRIFRSTPISGAARGPFCLMGTCFECLVEIDGIGNQQACMIEVREGIRIKRQQGAVNISAHIQTDGKLGAAS